MVFTVFGCFSTLIWAPNWAGGPVGGVWGLKSAHFQVLGVLAIEFWVYLGVLLYLPVQTPPLPPLPPRTPKTSLHRQPPSLQPSSSLI